ncbi:hypothetical protein C2I18_01505 [Paenibacillus sp. PK3_47]|nr:hypothetical protein C2I18_01505 [Paenibacillus sp. PK3_47]
MFVCMGCIVKEKLRIQRNCGECLDFRPLLSSDFLINTAFAVEIRRQPMLSKRAFLRKAFRRMLALLQFQTSPSLLPPHLFVLF